MTRSDRNRWSAVIFASLLAVGAAGRAHAEPSAIQKSTADALFKEGKKLLDAKDFDAACPKLAESATLQPGGGVQLALALCHEGQGKLATAYNDYREALALAKRDKRKDREDIAAGKLAELEPVLSHLVVSLSDAAKAQTVSITLDGAMLASASWGIPIPVDGGTHVVVATATGKKDQSIEVVVKPKGDKKELEIPALADAPKTDEVIAPVPTGTTSTSSDTPVAPTETKKSGSNVGPYVLGAVGVVALSVGAYFGVKAMGASSDAKNACPGNECTSSDPIDKNDQARSSARIANVGVGLGVLALSGAVIWWALTPGDAPKTETAMKGRLTGGIGPGGAGVGWVMPW